MSENLAGTVLLCLNDTRMSKKKPPTISGVLRDALKEESEHLYAVATGSGVSYNNLWRFLSNDRQLTQREIDLLAGYLGLRLVAVKQKA